MLVVFIMIVDSTRSNDDMILSGSEILSLV